MSDNFETNSEFIRSNHKIAIPDQDEIDSDNPSSV